MLESIMTVLSTHGVFIKRKQKNEIRTVKKLEGKSRGFIPAALVFLLH